MDRGSRPAPPRSAAARCPLLRPHSPPAGRPAAPAGAGLPRPWPKVGRPGDGSCDRETAPAPAGHRACAPLARSAGRARWCAGQLGGSARSPDRRHLPRCRASSKRRAARLAAHWAAAPQRWRRQAAPARWSRRGCARGSPRGERSAARRRRRAPPRSSTRQSSTVVVRRRRPLPGPPMPTSIRSCELAAAKAADRAPPRPSPLRRGCASAWCTRALRWCTCRPSSPRRGSVWPQYGALSCTDGTGCVLCCAHYHADSVAFCLLREQWYMARLGSSSRMPS